MQAPAGRGSRWRSLVDFVCERLSLAVVAIGGVFAIVVFAVVEVHAAHIGYFPFHFESNADTVQVDGGSAFGGRLQTGDRIDLDALTGPQRLSLIAPHADARLPVTVMRGAHRYRLELTPSIPAYSKRATIARDIGIPVSFFLSLGLASALLLLQPRSITLAFYAYTIFMLLKVYQTPLDLAAWPMSFVSQLAVQVIYPATQLMILVFVQRLYGRPGKAWPAIFGTAIVLAIVVFAAWIDPIVWLVTQRFGWPGPTRVAMGGADALLLVVVLCGLAYIASGAPELDRKRVTWIVAGIALAPILDLTWALTDLTSALVGDTSKPLIAIGIWTDALGPWFGLLGVACVFYGFVSQRVVDFRFAIGRAFVYGALTVALVLLFGAIEWWAEQIFETTRPAVYASLAVALLIGFAMRALHGQIEGFLEGVAFRSQRRDEEALGRAARALSGTTSERTVCEFLIGEPVRVLGLQSAVLFLQREPNEPFVRTAIRGDAGSAPEGLEPEDPLVIGLRSEFAPVELDGRVLGGANFLRAGPKATTWAVPLVIRARLFAIAAYGPRKNGLALIPSERALLERIAAAAAAAFDHIDAERSRERIAQLEARLQALEASGAVTGGSSGSV